MVVVRGNWGEQLATPAACRTRGQAVIFDCWVEVGGWRMEVGGCRRGRDKSPLIKAVDAEQGLAQNLNQPIIQTSEKKGGDCGVFVAVKCGICNRWAPVPCAGLEATL